jgi:AraC-like DNA-binding protein
MGTRPLDPMVVAAVSFSVDRAVMQRGQTVSRPVTGELAALYDYWSRAASIVGDDLALIVATDLPTGAFGLASYGLISQPTLQDALTALGTTYLDKLVPGMGLRVLPLPFDQVEIRLQSDGDEQLMPLLEEIVLAVVHRHLALLTTPATVLGVNLRRPAPSSTQPWRAFFGVAPRFGQRYTALQLGAQNLGVGLRTASPELASIVQTVAANPPPDSTIAGRVKEHIRMHLRDEPDAQAIATALQMTARTLQRKLQAETTSVRDIAAAIRIDVAKQMLEHGDATIAEIADTVGFAQPASFSRAFAAAMNETPQDYRRRVRG